MEEIKLLQLNNSIHNVCCGLCVYVDTCVNLLPSTADPGHNVLFAFSAVFIYAACVSVQSNLWPSSCRTLQVKNAVILDDDSSSVFLSIFCQANRFSYCLSVFSGKLLQTSPAFWPISFLMTADIYSHL